MQETPEQFLRRLFESDKNAPDYYERNPMYQGDHLLGTKPWWPPLSEVWRRGEKCPSNHGNRATWAEAWALLDRYHRQYLATAKGGR